MKRSNKFAHQNCHVTFWHDSKVPIRSNSFSWCQRLKQLGRRRTCAAMVALRFVSTRDVSSPTTTLQLTVAKVLRIKDYEKMWATSQCGKRPFLGKSPEHWLTISFQNSKHGWLHNMQMPICNEESSTSSLSMPAQNYYNKASAQQVTGPVLILYEKSMVQNWQRPGRSEGDHAPRASASW